MDSDGNEDSDKELLRRFVEDDEETAFGRLVDRHGAMVRGVALRCTGDAALSDEVTQSVFFLLARRAGSVSADHLGGWLHRSAFLTARNARRNSLRYKQALRELGRQHHVMTGNANSDPSPDGAPWEEIRPYLDEAVARLPERTRLPVMMRFFESRSIRDIASHTGKSEAAVRKVLERSLQRLSGLLRRRGVVTNGASLGVVLSAQSLLSPPASAAALAATALSASNLAGAAVGPAFLVSGPLRFLAVPSSLKGAGMALLLGAIPVAILWRQNSVLRRDLGSMHERMPDTRTSLPSRPVVDAQSVRPAPAVAANAQPREKTGPNDKNSPTAFKEKSAREATRELARMNLYLPGLAEDQRARILAVYEECGMRRAEAFEQARQTGAFARLAGGIETLTAEDKALFKSAHTIPGEAAAENEALKTILTAEQYALHLQAAERRRVNAAEGVASDTLRSLGQAFDLSTEQKDAIFQDVAQFELNPSVEEEGSAADLPSPFREQGRERIIRKHLSEEQALLFDQRREDDRRRREQFLQTLQPAR